MRIDVVGAGAVGTPLAVRLAGRGEDVRVVVREHLVEPLRTRGLTLVEGPIPRNLPVPVADRTRADADLVVLTVKTQDVREACGRVTPGPGAVVVLANGLDADGIAREALPRHRIVPGVVVFDAASDTAGTSTVRRPGGLLLPIDAPAEADALSLAAPIERRSDFEGARWTKLIVNLGNGLNAATGLPAQKAYRGAGARVGHALLSEGVAVARAAGVRLAPIPWMTPAQLRFIASVPRALGGPLLTLKVQTTFRATPAEGSTLQSLRRGRPTEVRFLNGAIVERGRRVGIRTPANEAVVDAVERAEKGGGYSTGAEIEAAQAHAGR